MLQQNALHTYVFARLDELFGKPTNTLQKDQLWTIRTSEDHYPVHVLLNGSVEIPAMWIFSHEPVDGVHRAALSSEGEIDRMIKLVQTKVQNASRVSDR